MQDKECQTDLTRNHITLIAVLGAILLWFSQPPFGFWWAAYFALVPWLVLVRTPQRFLKGDYVRIWLVAGIYWAVSLQGLRHANPLIYPCWLALSGYLAIYVVLFVLVCRQMSRRIPLWVAAPVCLVGAECARNYMLTGISAAMLGHTQVDMPLMIQIADIFGSYGVGFVVASINVAIFELVHYARKKETLSRLIPSVVIAAGLVAATVVYGNFRLNQTGTETLATFALIQRSEPVEYAQDSEREIEIFEAYERQSVRALASAKTEVDAVVWPESMYTGDLPLMLVGQLTTVPKESELSLTEFLDGAYEMQQMFEIRSSDLQIALASKKQSRSKPHLIAGCGVLDFRDRPYQFSGVVHVGPASRVEDWYGKQHRVMFGEYIPILEWFSALDGIVPKIDVGPIPKAFSVNGTRVSPNVCIETAVERVTLGQLAQLRALDQMPDVVVTVTNDAWFDESSVVEHHLRCAQLVAVGCRRPILSAANNGPTAWIASDGSVTQRLDVGSQGDIIATPIRDDRVSVYLRIGDWPARILTLLCLGFLIASFRDRNAETHAPATEV